MAVIEIDLGPNLEGNGENPTPIKLSDKITPGAYTNVDITVNAQGLITAIANGSPGGAGVSVYDAGSGGLTNFFVRATVGVTITRSADGIYEMDIPDGGIVEAFWKEMDNFSNDLDGSGNAQMTITNNTAGVNTNRTTARIPIYWIIDSAGNQRNPGDVGLTVQMTSVSGGDTVQSINGLNGLGSPLMLKGKF